MPIQRSSDGKFSTALTEQLHARIVADVESGLFDAQIAHKNGIDVTTLKSWVDRGLDEEAEEKFKRFAEDYIKAAIQLEEKTVRSILDAAEMWHQVKDTRETLRGGGVDFGEVDSSDVVPSGYSTEKKKKERTKQRGDWKAAAWFLERRWPLRWGITRQPEGGPKEAIKLPEASQNRRKRIDEMTGAPPPELIKLFRDKGWDIVRKETKA